MMGIQNHKGTRLKKISLLLLALVAIGSVSWLLFGQKSKQPTSPPPGKVANEQKDTKQPAVKPLPNIQSDVDAWLSRHSGTYSIVVQDLATGDVVAAHNEHRTYFMASIYKLYTAYVGLIKVQQGEFRLEEPYLNGWSRQKCIEEMMRTSHSPCGEKLMAEIGRQNIENKLKEFGLKDTDFGTFETSASDAAIILERLQRRRDLNNANAQLLLNPMKDQEAKYRRGLPAGFKNSVVYNKVGWNETVEWHDTAIAELANGRPIGVAVFTANAGSKNVSQLAAAIEQALARQ